MAGVGSTPTGGNYSIRQLYCACYCTIPQLEAGVIRSWSSSWTLNASTTLYTGVAQRKRAVKHRPQTFLPLVVRFEDGYWIYTTEDVGSKPTTGIFFYLGYGIIKTDHLESEIETRPEAFTFFNEVLISLKKNVLTHVTTLHMFQRSLTRLRCCSSRHSIFRSLHSSPCRRRFLFLISSTSLRRLDLFHFNLLFFLRRCHCY